MRASRTRVGARSSKLDVRGEADDASKGIQADRDEWASLLTLATKSGVIRGVAGRSAQLLGAGMDGWNESVEAINDCLLRIAQGKDRSHDGFKRQQDILLSASYSLTAPIAFIEVPPTLSVSTPGDAVVL